MIAWLRYLAGRAVALPRPAGHDPDRYPRTLRGGWRYWREQAAPADVAAWAAHPQPPSLWWWPAVNALIVGGIYRHQPVLWLTGAGVFVLFGSAFVAYVCQRAGGNPR